MTNNTMECRITCTDTFTELDRRAEKSRIYREFDVHYKDICFGPYIIDGLTTEGLMNPLYHWNRRVEE